MLGGDRISVPKRPRRTKNLTVYFFSVKRGLSRETASAARLLLRIVRRAVSRAPSTFGGFADNMRRQVLELMTMAQRHSLSSFEIDSVIRPSVAVLSSRALANKGLKTGEVILIFLWRHFHKMTGHLTLVTIF